MGEGNWGEEKSFNQKLSNKCSLSNGHMFDTRYQKIQNFSVSKYSLQEASGVFEILNRQPHASEIPLKVIKEQEMYSFYMRPTIEWDVMCEG